MIFFQFILCFLFILFWLFSSVQNAAGSKKCYVWMQVLLLIYSVCCCLHVKINLWKKWFAPIGTWWKKYEREENVVSWDYTSCLMSRLQSFKLALYVNNGTVFRVLFWIWKIPSRSWVKLEIYSRIITHYLWAKHCYTTNKISFLIHCYKAVNFILFNVSYSTNVRLDNKLCSCSYAQAVGYSDRILKRVLFGQ